MIPDWEVTERIFAQSGVTYEFLSASAELKSAEGTLNGHCPESGMTDQEYLFHAWNGFTIKVHAGSPNPFRLVVHQEG
jgi:hypothetical protein